MTEGNESDGGNAIENSSATIKSPILSGQLFGPFTNPFHWLSFKSCDNTCTNNNNPSDELFSNIEIARHSEEQNMKIVYKNGNFYFKAMRNIDADTDKTDQRKENSTLFAWFSKDLVEKLPKASSSTINGSTRYFCPLCNEVFMYPNPVISHMLCTCPKRIQIDSIPLPSNNQISASTLATIQSSTVPTQSAQETKPQITKKRGFDIASLVKEESDESSSNKCPKNGIESEKSGNNVVLSNSSAFHRPKSPPPIRKSNTSMGVSSQPMQTHMSAFKKVDQKMSSVSNPYDFSNIYNRVATSSMLTSTTHSVNHPMIPQMPLQTSLPTTLPTSLSSSGTKSLMSNTLLPYLPPSLAALTFPTSNWCAKCNATFRMTSDLVYHMRSHHKSSLTFDPLKKKREEKLRCSICHETFRERHHLTRHMSSHQ
jgi:uncharacterized C2H2 Zn-finger protein